MKKIFVTFILFVQYFYAESQAMSKAIDYDFVQSDSIEIATTKIYYSFSNEKIDSFYRIYLDSINNEEIIVTQYFNITREKNDSNYIYRGYYKNRKFTQFQTTFDGSYVGKCNIYYESDTLGCKSMYVKGKKHGLESEFDNNRIYEKHFIDGVQHGISTTYENGKMIEYVNYVDGLKDGIWVAFNNYGGCLESYKIYERGKVKDGIYEMYYDCNSVARRFYYKNHKLKKVIFYGDDGVISRIIKGKNLGQD